MHQMVANKPAVSRPVAAPYRLLAESGPDGGGGGGGIVCVRLGSVHVVAVSCRAPPWPARCCAATTPSFTDRPTTFAATAALSVGYRSASIGPAGDQWRKMRRVLTAEVLAPATERRLRAARLAEADHLVRALCCGAVDVRHVARHFYAATSTGGSLWGRRRHFAFASRRPQPAAAAAAGGPGRDETEHVDALFAALNYLDAFCVSDYFPALVQQRQAGLPGAVARHAHHRDAAREAPAGAGVPLEQHARRGQDPAPGRPRRALCWPTRSLVLQATPRLLAGESV